MPCFLWNEQRCNIACKLVDIACAFHGHGTNTHTHTHTHTHTNTHTHTLLFDNRFLFWHQPTTTKHRTTNITADTSKKSNVTKHTSNSEKERKTHREIQVNKLDQHINTISTQPNLHHRLSYYGPQPFHIAACTQVIVALHCNKPTSFLCHCMYASQPCVWMQLDQAQQTKNCKMHFCNDVATSMPLVFYMR
jgi:Flp pilus assembly protein TadB